MSGSTETFWLSLVAGFFLPIAVCTATEPDLSDISPPGGQRGTELELTFSGTRLQDTEEIFCCEPGVTVTKLSLATNSFVKATVKLSPECSLGEHHFRLRTATGLSAVRTFWVGPFPVTEEIEPNDELVKAQRVALNTTVSGTIKNEDSDLFLFEAKKGQRCSVEVEGMRLGRSSFDPRLSVTDSEGKEVAAADDTWLGKQDPYVSWIASKDGTNLVRLREATYGGSDQCKYLLHIGTYPRPAIAYPLGGKAGETNSFIFIMPGVGSLTNSIKMPDSLEEKFGIFATDAGQSAPTANWIRVSPFTNVLASGTNHQRDAATIVPGQVPFALNGIISAPGQDHWFRFAAQKGVPLNFNLYGRRLHSPIDSIIEVQDSTGKSLGSNDDAAGADSVLRITPPETTNYLLRVTDTLGQGGEDFVYRLEVGPDEPSLVVKIPEVARADTQSRQFVAVPRGNRGVVLISGRRSNLSGELSFVLSNAPAGLTMSTNRMAANVDSMPLVFEAETNASTAGRLLDLVAFGTNGTNIVTGRFRQDIDLVLGPNNASFYNTSVTQFCVAVTKEAPFRVRIIQPNAPLVQSGSLDVKVAVDRNPGFDEPVELQMVWNPPGISSQPEITIPKSGTNGTYTLNASAGAEVRTWKIAIQGHAAVEGGQVYVSSQLADLEVASPYLTGKIETLWTNPGKPGKLTVNLQNAKPFDGKSKIRLVGLPDKVTAAEREIAKEDKEVTFDVNVETNCPIGSHKNLSCAVDVLDKGVVISHTIAQGGILRIVPPKKTENVAAAAK